MHILSHTKLKDFYTVRPDAESALERWYKHMEKASYQNFAELRADFPSADLVGDFVVFNIGGNKYRLIASIHFNRGKVFIRYILTHSEYNLGKWKEQE